MKHTSSKLRKMKRVRSHLGRGTATRPRVSVYRSNRYMYVQAIDDEKRVTIASASTLAGTKKADQKKRLSTTAVAAREVGKQLGAALIKKGIKMSLFDRGPYLYHGKVKALADGLREAGIQV